NLPHKKRRACVAFIALGLAVLRWTAFDDVGNVDIFAPDAHRLDHVVQQLSGSAHKGFALLIFIGTGTFADKHEFGAWIANPKDDLLAPQSAEFATSAIGADLLLDDIQGRNRIGHAIFRQGIKHFENTGFGNFGYGR